jgi:thiamine kinase-like enzyme
MTKDYFASDKFKQDVKNLIKKITPSDKFTWISIKRGRNNRVFCVDISGWGKALLKAYFKHPDDPRDRLSNEFSFSRFAWNNGLRCLHEPYLRDDENHLGLYQFIEGRNINKEEVNEEFISQALDFFIELNDFKHLPEAKRLANASEACFSIHEHLDTVEKRLNRLKSIGGSSEINSKAISFIENELSRSWDKTTEYVQKLINNYEIDSTERVSSDDKCISPSDFGFHNAILDEHGKIYFVDFEYAGWDDPAKMVCDFFCQPEIPVPLSYYESFVKKAFSKTSNPEKHIQRANILLPVYRIKWCCIILNEFLEHDTERRFFAQEHLNREEEKTKQLSKAKQYLKDLDQFMLEK